MRRLTLVIAALLASWGVVPATAQGAGDAPDSFSVTARADAISTLAAVPVALPLQAEVGIGVSRVKLNSQPFIVTDAAPVFVPVLGALEGGGDVAALTSCTATYPGEPHELTCGGLDESVAGVTVAGGSGRAVANSDPADVGATRGEAAARAAEIDLTGLRVAGVASAATARLEDGRIVGGAATAVTEFVVAGVLRISGIRSEISGALGGIPGSGAVATTFEIGGASLAGIPVTIDETGLRIDGGGLTPGLLDTLQQQANALLAEAGITIRLVPPRTAEVDEDGTGLVAASGGLRVTVDLGGGSFVDLTVGVAELSMSATRFPPLGQPDPPAPDADDAAAPTATPGAARPAAQAPPPAPEPGAGAPDLGPIGRVGGVADPADWQSFYVLAVGLVALAPILTAVRRSSWATLKKEALRD